MGGVREEWKEGYQGGQEWWDILAIEVDVTDLRDRFVRGGWSPPQP
jgi:hypothetical protein